MNYSKNYIDLFTVARFAINRDLEQYYNFLTMCHAESNPPSLHFLSMAADALTAYNELSYCDFFIKIEYFRPIKNHENKH